MRDDKAREHLIDNIVHMAGRVTNHHFLAQWYLRNFSPRGSEDQIFQINKTDPQRTHLVAIKNAGCIRDFHTLDKADGVRDSETIENLLSRLEALQCAVVDAVIRGETLTESQHGELCEFASFMQFRVPSMKSHIEQSVKALTLTLGKMLAKDDRLERAIETHHPEIAEYPLPVRKAICDRMRDKINSKRLSVEVSNQNLMGHMFALAFDPRGSKVFGSMGWCICEAAKGENFVTCDQPVATFDPSGMPDREFPLPLFAPGMEVTFPLGSRTLLKFDGSRRFHGQRINLGAEETREMNRRTIIMADRFLYSASVNEVMKSLVRDNARFRAGMRDPSIVTIVEGDKYQDESFREDVYPAARYSPRCDD